MGRETVVISECLRRDHCLDPAMGARNPMAYPPLNALPCADDDGHLPKYLLLCARAEMGRELPALQTPADSPGCPMMELLSFFHYFKN